MTKLRTLSFRNVRLHPSLAPPAAFGGRDAPAGATVRSVDQLTLNRQFTAGGVFASDAPRPGSRV